MSILTATLYDTNSRCGPNTAALLANRCQYIFDFKRLLPSFGTRKLLKRVYFCAAMLAGVWLHSLTLPHAVGSGVYRDGQGTDFRAKKHKTEGTAWHRHRSKPGSPYCGRL